MSKKKIFSKKGFTLIEAMIVVFIVSVTAVAFYSVFSLGTRSVIDSKNRLGAVALANEKMETIRNLDYEDIGTKKEVSGEYVYGIPAGEILEEEAINRDNRDYYVKTLVQYIDDPFDGMEDGSPDDDLPTDYKKVRIEVAWNPDPETNKEVSLVSTFVPSGIEQPISGGTLSINVIDNEGLGIPQAAVHIYNSAASIDINTVTDDSGNLTFPGSPAGEQNYSLEISKSDYYSVHTYSPYPTSYFYPVDVHASVVEGKLNVKSIITDKTSDLIISAEDFFGNAIPDLSFDIEGGKKIGDSAADPSEPIFDFSQTSSFDSSGARVFSNRSFGVYFFQAGDDSDYLFSKLDNEQAEPDLIDLPPGGQLEVKAIYADKNVNSLLVKVIDDVDESYIADAQIKLKKDDINYDVDLISDKYGQAFFPQELPELEAGEYQLTVQATGYKQSVTAVDVDNFVLKEIKLIFE